MTPGETPPDPIPAAACVRMSTEHQQYSTSNQVDVIREYAKRREVQINTEYANEGKSGLNIQGRDSLAQMIKDVQSGAIRGIGVIRHTRRQPIGHSPVCPHATGP